MKMIRDNGGLILRIKRGPEPEWFSTAENINHELPDRFESIRKDQKMSKYPDIHYSEWAWIGYPVDFTIENNGSLEDLKRQVNEYLTSTVK
jgi:hypothetical protein